MSFRFFIRVYGSVERELTPDLKAWSVVTGPWLGPGRMLTWWGWLSLWPCLQVESGAAPMAKPGKDKLVLLSFSTGPSPSTHVAITLQKVYLLLECLISIHDYFSYETQTNFFCSFGQFLMLYPDTCSFSIIQFIAGSVPSVFIPSGYAPSLVARPQTLIALLPLFPREPCLKTRVITSH